MTFTLTSHMNLSDFSILLLSVDHVSHCILAISSFEKNVYRYYYFIVSYITPHEPASSLFEPICEARIARRDIVQSQRWRLRIRDQLEKGSGQEEKP
jgi:hypothetical protein